MLGCSVKIQVNLYALAPVLPKGEKEVRRSELQLTFLCALCFFSVYCNHVDSNPKVRNSLIWGNTMSSCVVLY